MQSAWAGMTPHDRARALVLAYGWNATSYQILNPGFSLWFNRECTAVAGYVEQHGVRVVTGRCWEEGGAPPYWPWRSSTSAAKDVSGVVSSAVHR